MYAIVDCRGEQLTVRPGERVAVPHIDGEPGTKVTLERVLYVGGDKPTVGTPLVAGATVAGTIHEQARDAKVTIFKFRRRTKYRKLTGHRQLRTVLQIDSIQV